MPSPLLILRSVFEMNLPSLSAPINSELNSVSDRPLEQRGDQPYHNNFFSRSDVIPPATDDISALEVVGLKVPEGLIYPEQRSYFCTLVWCEHGNLIVNGRGWTLEANGGEVVVLNTEVTFSASAGKEGAEGYYLLVDGSRCIELLKQAKLWQGTFRYSEIPRDWLNMVAMGLSRPDRQAMASHIAYQLFHQVGQQIAESFQSPLLWKASLYIQTHWNDPALNVESLLGRLDTCRSRLSALFREHLDVSILQYVSGVRLGHAKQMLAESSQPISNIAEACGLRDASYFSNWFRKQSGQCPTEFRENVRA